MHCLKRQACFAGQSKQRVAAAPHSKRVAGRPHKVGQPLLGTYANPCSSVLLTVDMLGLALGISTEKGGNHSPSLLQAEQPDAVGGRTGGGLGQAAASRPVAATATAAFAAREAQQARACTVGRAGGPADERSRGCGRAHSRTGRAGLEWSWFRRLRPAEASPRPSRSLGSAPPPRRPHATPSLHFHKSRQLPERFTSTSSPHVL